MGSWRLGKRLSCIPVAHLPHHACHSTTSSISRGGESRRGQTVHGDATGKQPQSRTSQSSKRPYSSSAFTSDGGSRRAWMGFRCRRGRQRLQNKTRRMSYDLMAADSSRRVFSTKEIISQTDWTHHLGDRHDQVGPHHVSTAKIFLLYGAMDVLAHHRRINGQNQLDLLWGNGCFGT